MSNIVGPLPAQISAGQPVTAAPVMADLNWIKDQVNSNAQPLNATVASRVMVTCVGATNLATTVPLIIGSSANTGQVTTVAVDALSEFDTTTGKFTAKNAGYYQIMGNGMGLPNGSTISAEPQFLCRKNGSVIDQPSFFCFVEGHTTFDTLVGSNFSVTHLNVGDYLTATVTFFFSGGTAIFQHANLSIIGLGA